MTDLSPALNLVARLDVCTHLPDLHAALEQQRRFRLDQLQELDATVGAASASAADGPLSEVTLLVRAAAVGALADIDSALDRIRVGCYGQCQTCDTPIALERLEILPAVRQCMPCQVAHEAHARSGRSAPTTGPPRRRLGPSPINRSQR